MILTKSNKKEINLDLLVETRVKEGRLSDLLIIVPTNRKIRSLKRELISASPGKATSKINLETIGTYSINLLLGENGRNSLVSEQASIVLLKQSFQEVELKYFSIYNGNIPFGTLDRIKNVISEYKRHGITPEKLRAESENLSGTEKIKAEDIANIFERYRRKYNELEIRDIGDVYKELNESDRESFQVNFTKYYPDVSLIIINGFDEFTLPEIEIINSSADLKNVELYIYFDYYKYNPFIFSHLDNCYKNLEHKGFKVLKDLSSIELTKFVTDVRENLFTSKKSGIKNYKKQINEIAAFNPEDEIARIAKEVKKLILHDNIDPNKICVAFNLIKPYSSVVRDQFEVFGIPYNLTDRLSLSTSSPVITIINLLEIIENDFYYKNIFRALSNEFTGRLSIDLNNLLKASIELKIISGFKTWKERLNDAVEEQQLGDGTEDEYKRYKVNYEKALNDIEKIRSFLNSFVKRMTTEEFHNNLLKMIADLNLHIAVLNSVEENIEKDVKAINAFVKSVEELMSLLQLEYGKQKTFPLKFFLNELKTIALFSRYNVKERPGYGVLVTTLNEIRGLQFDYLFIAGLNDGNLPTRFSPEIFFSGSFVREELNHQTEERYQFYQALCSWRKGLYLTYPHNDEKKELVESNFLIELKNTFDLSTINSESYNDTIYSQYDLLKYVGKNVEQDLGLKNERGINLGYIKKAIEVNNIRLQAPFSASPYTGILTNQLDDELKNKLNEFREKQFSVTQLESYAKCPYQYFAERVLHLTALEEPTEELEAFELGTLLHSILYEFYSTLKEWKLVLAGSNDSDFARAEKLIFKVAENKIEELKLSSALTFYEKEKILGIEGNKRNSILYKFLNEERDSRDGFIPQYFEMSFGDVKNPKGEKLSGNKKFKAAGVNVRGKIDRVDLNETEKTIKVIDYKLTGRKPAKNDLLTGISLQLPLYLYAAKKLINAELNENYDPLGSEIYSLKFNEKDFGPKLIRSDNSRSYDKERLIEMSGEMINVCLGSIEKYVDQISSGKFNLTTLEDRENKVCGYCSFRSICRIQEID